jgi:serine/threonine-protein kinase HipA
VPLRFSLAGIQLTFSAIGEASGGLTIPAQGTGGSWIVKLPSLRFNSVSENEFVMLELARAIGIEVPRLALIPPRDIKGLPLDAAVLPGLALATQRFDRAPNGDPIHMEDFAQVFGLYPESKYKSASYANIARVLQAEAGPQAVQNFVTRLTFNVLIGNADMHLKNWSLLYPDKLRPTLSPAYDFVSTLPYIAEDSLALTLGGSRSLSEITVDQLRRFADAASLPLRPLIETVTSTTEATAQAWNKLPQRRLLPAPMRKQIHQQIESTARLTARNLTSS